MRISNDQYLYTHARTIFQISMFALHLVTSSGLVVTKDMFSWKLAILEQKRRAVVSLKVECLSSTEVGPFPSFIEKVNVIVREIVESHQLPAGQAISGMPVKRQRIGESMHPSE